MVEDLVAAAKGAAAVMGAVMEAAVMGVEAVAVMAAAVTGVAVAKAADLGGSYRQKEAIAGWTMIHMVLAANTKFVV